ncbi:hypothetical protein [Corallococcus sp. EGB]|uniref:hypothetical protein n=1 Tax=Corallococcus sp. EGB TaxID=1521117 RepID=UPI001CBD970A|nr:hypothetical protein [Corallococcus sp. EGB]
MRQTCSPTWRGALRWLLMAPALLWGPLVHADEPVYEMEAAALASYFTVDIYTVKKGGESAFLTQSLRSGPYDRIATGFGSEKIVEVLPTQRDADSTYIVLGRYFDPDMGASITRYRQTKTDALTSTSPTRLQGKLVDVILSDWSWEHNHAKGLKKAANTFVRAMPYQDSKVFQEYTASLNFMKIGYVGQTASVEFFDAKTPLDDIRKAITGRPGMSGTAILSLSDGSGYAAYTEYYELPSTLKTAKLSRAAGRVAGAATGVVIENYMAR